MSEYDYEEWWSDLPKLNEIDYEGTALSSLRDIKYANISEGLHHQFCGNSIQCEEVLLVCDKTNDVFSMEWCEDMNVLLKRISERNENKNGHI